MAQVDSRSLPVDGTVTTGVRYAVACGAAHCSSWPHSALRARATRDCLIGGEGSVAGAMHYVIQGGQQTNASKRGP